MEHILFVDACMRGPEQSRTLGLCRRFLSEYTALRPESQVVRRDLTGAELPVMTAQLARQRDELAAAGTDHPLLAPARELAGADLVVVGAPCWDLSFPAALKVYLEWSSVLGITFRYTRDGRQVGLSRARALVYLTTAGGPLEGQSFGFDYLRGLAGMLGIRTARCVAAERLDIWGTDAEAVLSQAGERAAALARELAGAEPS